MPTQHASCALCPGLLDERQNLRMLRLVCHRAELGGRIEGVADAHALHTGHQMLYKAVVNAVMHQQARASDAGLAKGQENAG